MQVTGRGSTIYREDGRNASAIIVAGGSGKRMKAKIRKQYLLLGGRMILSRTLSVFLLCQRINRIYLVAPENDFDFIRQKILPNCGGHKEIILVAGGRERQQSVYNGIHAVDAQERYVVVHDGVRPLITSEDIEKCLGEAMISGACILGIAASETIKKVSENKIIEKTLNRDRLWLAQTPQCFERDLLLKAHESADAEGFIGTDDSCLLERMGIRVRILSGSPYNMKITTPEDLSFAEELLKIGTFP